jgi:hypothetical protein
MFEQMIVSEENAEIPLVTQNEVVNEIKRNIIPREAPG